jgi:hypothetical protein
MSIFDFKNINPLTITPTQGVRGSGMLTAQPPAVQLASRSIGGLLGLDMRTPQEKIQAELTQVKDPLSPEGLLQRAQIIAANATDAQSLQVGAALATESRKRQGRGYSFLKRKS